MQANSKFVVNQSFKLFKDFELEITLLIEALIYCITLLYKASNHFDHFNKYVITMY